MSSWFEKARDYGRNVTAVYLQILTPLAMLVVFNACVSFHAHDMEKEGLMWMHYTQTAEESRGGCFPRTEHEKSERRRSMAAVEAANL